MHSQDQKYAIYTQQFQKCNYKEDLSKIAAFKLDYKFEYKPALSK